MTDIVERMQEAACLPNTGCMSIKTCVCDIMGDAIDEIERLRKAALDLEISVMAASEHSDEGWHLAESFEDCITELNGFIETVNEQAVALESENGALREEIRRLRVEAGYD